MEVEALYGTGGLCGGRSYFGMVRMCVPGQSCAQGLPALPGSFLSNRKPTSAASATEVPGTLMSFHIQSRSNC